jgi:hypothetical protein
MRIESVRLDLLMAFAPDGLMWPIIALIDGDGRMTCDRREAVAFVAQTSSGPFSEYLSNVHLPTIQ